MGSSQSSYCQPIPSPFAERFDTDNDQIIFESNSKIRRL